MSELTIEAADVYRDFVVPGVSASGANEPVKRDIRALWASAAYQIEILGLVGAITVKKTTRALLYADLAHVADTLAVVYADATQAYNGIYAKVGGSGAGSWDIVFSFPDPTVTFDTNIYGVAYDADYVFSTAAERAANLPPSPTDGERMVTLFDPNPLNNVWELRVAGAWVEQGPVENALYIRSRTPSLAYSPAIMRWDTVWDSGFNNDGSYAGWVMNIDANGVTNFNPSAWFLEVKIDGERRLGFNNFQGLTDLRIGSDTDTFVGISHQGSGTMGFFSGLNAGSGLPEKLLLMAWSGTPGQVVELFFQGTSRVHIASAGALVLDAANSRMELEGSGGGRLGIVGYISASADGRIIDINNSGQSSYPGVLFSLSTVVNTQKLLQFCSLSGSTYTELAFVSPTGLGNFADLTIDKMATPVLSINSTALGKGSIKFAANAATSLVQIGLIDCDPNVGNMRLGTVRVSYWTEIISNSVVVMTFENNGNVGIGAKSYGGGVKVICLANATTAPTTNPVGGGVIYCDAGALKYRGTAGTVTTLGPA